MKKLFFIICAVSKIILFSIYVFPESIYDLKIPEQLENKNYYKNIIFDDINQDKLTDIILFSNEFIYISYQNKDKSFSDFEKIQVPSAGVFDIVDIFPGGNKEILFMHANGISCLVKNHYDWELRPRKLIVSPTVFDQLSAPIIEYMRFAFDIDVDSIPEILLFSREEVKIYKLNRRQEYELFQSFPLQYKQNLDHPGLKIWDTPIQAIFGTDTGIWYEKYGLLQLRYLSWTKRIISDKILLADINRDGKLDFVYVKSKEYSGPNKEITRLYSYEIYYADQTGKYPEHPSEVINDPYGIWVSPLCTDIFNKGRRDFIRYDLSTNRGVIERPKIKIEIFLQPEKGDYSLKPFQVIITPDSPLIPNPLVDIDGDGIKELVLIHPITQGLSLGDVISKYMEKGMEIEIRILKFMEKKGYTRDKMITARIKGNFLGEATFSLEGDFNGDGARDLLISDSNGISIYIFDKSYFRFNNKPLIKLNNVLSPFSYMVDLNSDNCSEILSCNPNKISVLFLK